MEVLELLCKSLQNSQEKINAPVHDASKRSSGFFSSKTAVTVNKYGAG